MKSAGREVDEVLYSPEPDVQEVTSVQLPQGPLTDQHLQPSERGVVTITIYISITDIKDCYYDQLIRWETSRFW